MQPVWSGHYQGTFNSASSCLKRSNFNFSCGSNSFPGREGQCVCPLADGKGWAGSTSVGKHGKWPFQDPKFGLNYMVPTYTSNLESWRSPIENTGKPRNVSTTSDDPMLRCSPWWFQSKGPARPRSNCSICFWMAASWMKNSSCVAWNDCLALHLSFHIFAYHEIEGFLLDGKFGTFPATILSPTHYTHPQFLEVFTIRFTSVSDVACDWHSSLSGSRSRRWSSAMVHTWRDVFVISSTWYWHSYGNHQLSQLPSGERLHSNGKWP